MPTLKDLLAGGRALVSDGAWGTELQARGLAAGQCPELWNAGRPGEVQGVAAAYFAAGADLALSNTFGGNEIKLAKFGLAGRMAELNRAGARLSLEAAAAAGRPALVAVSVGPTGEFMEPYGDLSEADMEAVYFRQAQALAEGGASLFCVETMTALEEACCAVRAIKKAVPGAEVIATMTFGPGPAGYRTMMGVDCRRAAEGLAGAGADVVGANCGNGMKHMIGVARELRGATGLPILIHANAGVPELVGGRTVFREAPAQMAARVAALVQAGACIIGGCCGTTPAHIAAIRQAVDALPARG